MPKMYNGSIDEVIKTLNSIQRKLIESIFEVQNIQEAKNYIKQTEKEIKALEYATKFVNEYYDHAENLENLSKKLGVAESRTATEKMDEILDRWYNDGWHDATLTFMRRDFNA